MLVERNAADSDFCFLPSPGVVPLKDSVPLSPLKPSSASADTEQQSTEGGYYASGNDMQPLRVSMETTNLRPQTPKDEHELEEDDEASGALTISELAYRSINLYNCPKQLFLIVCFIIKLSFAAAAFI